MKESVCVGGCVYLYLHFACMDGCLWSRDVCVDKSWPKMISLEK